MVEIDHSPFSSSQLRMRSATACQPSSNISCGLVSGSRVTMSRCIISGLRFSSIGCKLYLIILYLLCSRQETSGNIPFHLHTTKQAVREEGQIPNRATCLHRQSAELHRAHATPPR